MAQILSLKAETNAPGERTNIRPATDNDRQGFADAFERELKPSSSKADQAEGKSERTQNRNEEADSARLSRDKADREDDGKKLPEENSKAEKAAASEDKPVSDKEKLSDQEAVSADKAADEVEDKQQKAVLAAFERIPADPDKNAKLANANSDGNKANIDQTLSQQIAKLTAHLDKIKPEQPKAALSQALEKAEAKSSSPAASIRADILAALKGSANQSDKTTGSEIKIDKLLAKAAESGDINQKQLTEMLRQMTPQSSQSNATNERATAGMLMSSAASATAASSSPQSASVTNPTMQSLDVQADIKSPNWSRVVSSRVVWMAQQGTQQAELRLNPPTLGPVDVRLSVQNDQTTVSFIANNATTREALEQALPRLRESFQENGLQLAHADVGEQSSSEDENPGDEEFARGEATQVQVAVGEDDNPDVVNGDGVEVTDRLSLYA